VKDPLRFGVLIVMELLDPVIVLDFDDLLCRQSVEVVEAAGPSGEGSCSVKGNGCWLSVAILWRVKLPTLYIHFD